MHISKTGRTDVDLFGIICADHLHFKQTINSTRCIGKLLPNSLRLLRVILASDDQTSDLQRSAKHLRNCGSALRTFLDATNAFDRVDYVQSFSLLIRRDIPPVSLRFLLHIYTSRVTRMAWNGSFNSNIAVSVIILKFYVLSLVTNFVFRLNVLQPAQC